MAQGRVGLLPAAFNPPTNAHIGLAAAAQQRTSLDEVVFVLPQVLPHKGFDSVGFEQRMKLIEAAVADHPRWRAWSSSGGLFLEIAGEYRTLYGPDVAIFLLCGSDAAQRILSWDYGERPSIDQQLREFQMVVAARQGEYLPPPKFADRIHAIDLEPNLQRISSSRVREAISAGEEWRHLVPAAVAGRIESQRLYGAV